MLFKKLIKFKKKKKELVKELFTSAPNTIQCRGPVAAGPKDRDYSALLAWRKEKVQTSQSYCKGFPFSLTSYFQNILKTI